MQRVAIDHPNVLALGPDATGYLAYWLRSNGEVCALCQMLFTWSLMIDLDPVGYRERYCYQDCVVAMLAADFWDGAPGTEPSGWHRHPTTGRRRDPATGVEWRATLSHQSFKGLRGAGVL